MKKLSFLLLTLAFVVISCSDEMGDPRTSAEVDGFFLTNDVNGSGGSIPSEAGPNYNGIVENPFVVTQDEHISTFSIDADGAAFSNIRSYLAQDILPPADAIRTEEVVNYFNYSYPNPVGEHPISLEGEISDCPWNLDHKLMRIGIKGKDIPPFYFPPSNIVFLIDVSGSMGAPEKLEMLKEGFKLYVDQIRPIDKIGIVTYASSPGVLLEPTSGTDENKAFIKSQIDKLGASGSTNGEGGILTAYDLAVENFVEDGNNRVVLGTDGDFNVGISDQDELIELIEEKRELGVFLTVLGVGSRIYNEGAMEQLANNGNGNFEYLDNLEQLEKVFVDEYNKFFTVAKDVKIQVNFNPAVVKEYRLIGYENRLLQTEDFEDDKKDAGEIGAGQSITALYELVLESGETTNVPAIDVDFRYKHPNEDASILINYSIKDEGNSFEQSTDSHQFAAAAASFGLLLRDSEYKGEVNYELIYKWANNSGEIDPFGYKQIFLDLVNKADNL